jgi:hypothetical protein
MMDLISQMKTKQTQHKKNKCTCFYLSVNAQFVSMEMSSKFGSMRLLRQWSHEPALLGQGQGHIKMTFTLSLLNNSITQITLQIYHRKTPDNNEANTTTQLRLQSAKELDQADL